VSYITAARYAELTGRAQSEATLLRRTRASQMLDARIGNYLPDETTGWKLDLDDTTVVSVAQKLAVETWVAQAIMYFAMNNDGTGNWFSVRLGRFQASKGSGLGDASKQVGDMPTVMNIADSILVDSGIIKRAVKVL